MQESKGCVRAPTTNNGVRNPGLMQSHNGRGTCNEGGNVKNPCPASEVCSDSLFTKLLKCDRLELTILAVD